MCELVFGYFQNLFRYTYMYILDLVLLEFYGTAKHFFHYKHGDGSKHLRNVLIANKLYFCLQTSDLLYIDIRYIKTFKHYMPQTREYLHIILLQLVVEHPELLSVC